MGIWREPLYDGSTTVGRSVRIAMQRSCAGVEEAGQLGDRLALDPHRQREGADLEVGDAAVEHLAHQVVRLRAVERARAVAAAADHLDVAGDAHRTLAMREAVPSRHAERAQPRLSIRRGRRLCHSASLTGVIDSRLPRAARASSPAPASRASRRATSRRVFCTSLTSTWHQRGSSARRLGIVVMALRIELGRVGVGAPTRPRRGRRCPARGTTSDRTGRRRRRASRSRMKLRAWKLRTPNQGTVAFGAAATSSIEHSLGSLFINQ